MARKRYKPEEIVAKLRQVDVLVSQGQGINLKLTFHLDHSAGADHFYSNRSSVVFFNERSARASFE